MFGLATIKNEIEEIRGLLIVPMTIADQKRMAKTSIPWQIWHNQSVILSRLEKLEKFLEISMDAITQALNNLNVNVAAFVESNKGGLTATQTAEVAAKIQTAADSVKAATPTA